MFICASHFPESQVDAKNTHSTLIVLLSILHVLLSRKKSSRPDSDSINTRHCLRLGAADYVSAARLPLIDGLELNQ
jgi:hypothetical protein